MNISTPIAVCAEEISNIGKENGILQKEKETLDSIKLSIKLFENSIAHDKSEIEKQNDKLKYYSAVSDEEKASLENELKSVRNELSSLGIFEIKKRKELKEKEKSLDDRFIKARIYLSTVDELAKLEDDLNKCSERLPELISNRDALQTKLEAEEKELMTRTEDAIKAIGITERRKEAIAEAITCPSYMLPNSLLSVLITNEKSPLIRRLNLDQKIKLLWDRDIPVRFGSMDWNVMEIRKDRAFLILRGTVYDDTAYSSIYGKDEGSWEKSNGRERLNGEFLERFSEEEKAFIIPNEKVFGDKFTILDKNQVEEYLGYYQRDTESHWWTSSAIYYKDYDKTDKCSVYYWNSYYDAEYGWRDSSPFYTGNPHRTHPQFGNSGRNIRIGYRPVVWVKIKEDPTDTTWAEFWKSSAEQSIKCRDKWSTYKNTAPQTTVSVSDVQDKIRNIYNGSSTSPRNPLDDYNSNGTPSGHGGRFK